MARAWARRGSWAGSSGAERPTRWTALALAPLALWAHIIMLGNRGLLNPQREPCMRSDGDKRMPIKLLEQMAKEPLPMLVRETDPRNKVRALEAAGLVHALVSEDQDAVLVCLTEKGRRAIKPKAGIAPPPDGSTRQRRL